LKLVQLERKAETAHSLLTAPWGVLRPQVAGHVIALGARGVARTITTTAGTMNRYLRIFVTLTDHYKF